MHALSLYSERLRHVLGKFVRPDGSIDASDIDAPFVEEKRAELLHILDALPSDHAEIRARLDADPDLHGIELKRRLVALADWTRVVIGVIEREVKHPRGPVLTPDNDP